MAFTIDISPSEISSVRNPIGLKCTADPGWAGLSDYHLLLTVSIEDGYRTGNYLTVDLKQYPDKNGEIVFNLRRLLRAYLKSDRPNWANPAAPRILQLSNKLYALHLTEYYNGIPYVGYDIEDRFVLRAGFSYQVGQNLDAWVNQTKFLTNQPRKNKRSTKVQPEFLVLCAPANPDYGELIIKCKVQLEDGTKMDASPAGTITVDNTESVMIPAGYNMLNLDGIGFSIVSWEVWLEKNDGPKAGEKASEVMQYHLDCECTVLDRYFLFENSLGGYDSIRMTAEHSTEIQVNSNQAQHVLSPFYEQDQRQVFHFGTSHLHKHKANTGILTRDEVLWLRELLISEDVLRVGDEAPNIDATGDLVPVHRDQDNLKILEDNNFLYGISFSYSESFINQGL